MWGGALRYKKEWGENWDVGAGIGYEKTTDERLLTGGGGLAGFRRDIQDWAGSASIKHKPTGLFVMGAFSFSDNDDSNSKHAGIFTGTSDPQMSAWDIEFGIQRGVPWFNLDKLGETSAASATFITVSVPQRPWPHWAHPFPPGRHLRQRHRRYRDYRR